MKAEAGMQNSEIRKVKDKGRRQNAEGRSRNSEGRKQKKEKLRK